MTFEELNLMNGGGRMLSIIISTLMIGNSLPSSPWTKILIWGVLALTLWGMGHNIFRHITKD